MDGCKEAEPVRSAGKLEKVRQVKKSDNSILSEVRSGKGLSLGKSLVIASALAPACGFDTVASAFVHPHQVIGPTDAILRNLVQKLMNNFATEALFLKNTRLISTTGPLKEQNVKRRA